MSEEKIKVSICMGSSCFARGSQKNLEIMQAYFSEKNLDERIDFSGHLCEDVCKQGPTLKIGEKVYYGVTHTNLRAILDDNFKDL